MVGKFLSLVKFSHTVFALPFALVGVGLALRDRMLSGQNFSWQQDGKNFLLVLVCMVTARNAAMAFNRWADRLWDAKNPRTAIREIPSGKLSATSALAFTAANAAAFWLATFFINDLCFYLAPIALAVVLGYSYTKRFTELCHLVLGVGLGLAPVGAYLAIAGHFSPTPIVLGFAVLTWVSGFDVIYALQDAEFDKAQKLHSIPAWLGPERALTLSSVLHGLSGILILEFAYLAGGSFVMAVGVAFFIALLIYQHSLVKPTDLSKVNLAFFTTNGLASVAFGLLSLLDISLVGAGIVTPLLKA